MTLSRYSITAFWGPRRETPEALAVRFNRLIDRLALINPAFGNWIWRDANKKPIPFVKIRSCLGEEVTTVVTRGDDGEPEPVNGYWMAVLNSFQDTPRSLGLSINAGGWALNKSSYSNTARLGTAWNRPPDPTIVTYRIFKPALLAIAETFEVTFCFAFPSDFGELWPKGQNFRFGWINYISPRFAPLITPPKTAIVEYRPDGGLLMAATRETFVTSNPEHMAVAQDIRASLAPLNALPWPPDAEPDPATATA